MKKVKQKCAFAAIEIGACCESLQGIATKQRYSLPVNISSSYKRRKQSNPARNRNDNKRSNESERGAGEVVGTDKRKEDPNPINTLIHTRVVA